MPNLYGQFEKRQGRIVYKGFIKKLESKNDGAEIHFKEM